MSNRSFVLGVVAIFITVLPVQGTDNKVDEAFQKVDSLAKQQRHWMNDKAAAKQCNIDITNINSVLANLNQPGQLINLMERCEHKRKEIPSDSKHEPYSNYFEQVTKFSIRKLGTMTSPDAVKAMNSDVPKTVHVDGSMGLVYDEAKAGQSKSLKLKLPTGE
jgi:hypothetical protein